MSKITLKTQFLGTLEYPNWLSLFVDVGLLVALLVATLYTLGSIL